MTSADAVPEEAREQARDQARDQAHDRAHDRADDSASLDPPSSTVLALRFTGSGSEYFRIWIVNLLLTLVTLGLYFPFAKARRLRYFLGNTLVDGQPLGWHGDPWKMLRGFLIVGVLVLVFGLADRVSPLASGLAGLVLAGLWPALWQASLRFRLANTSWRGLRLRFSGTVADAYRTLAPGLVLAVIFFGGSALLAMSGGTGIAAVLVTLMPLGGLLAYPYLMARIRRYQHNHFCWADQCTRLSVPTSAFYGAFIRASLLPAVPVALLMIVVGVSASVLPKSGSAAPAIVGVVFTLAMVSAVLLSRAYLDARLQNLVWCGTRADRLSVSSTLRARDLVWLSLKNLLLLVVTLGLYWPFAMVALSRLRLEAVSLTARGDPAQWSSPRLAAGGDAAGDAAADLLGIDVGL